MAIPLAVGDDGHASERVPDSRLVRWFRLPYVLHQLQHRHLGSEQAGGLVILHAVAQVAWWQVVLAGACGFLAGPVCSWLEGRQERIDRELWARIPGATR